MPLSASKISELTASAALRTPLPWYRALSPSRNSTASWAPVEAPDGTAARPREPSSRMTSTSTVGLPRLSRISRPIMSVIAVMGCPELVRGFYRIDNPLVMPRPERASTGAQTMRSMPMARKRLQLGQRSPIPASPEKVVLDRVPNPHVGTNYVARFTAPEFTTLCPITGQPDFAHLVIDYVPARFLVESKSLKLYLNSFRNHGAFHEDC